MSCTIISEMMSKVAFVWFAMFWCIFLQPVNVAIVGLFPIFLCPLLGITDSNTICAQYLDSYVILLIVGSWCLMLFNNSGITSRGLYNLIDPSDLSMSRLLFRCAFAAFIFSAVSHRLIVTSEIMALVTPVLINTQSAYAPDKSLKMPYYDYNMYRYILCSVIHTSATIGSLIFIHNNYTTMVALSMFNAVNRWNNGTEVFTHYTYTAFALPTSILMFTVNYIYYWILLQVSRHGSVMSDNTVLQITKGLTERRRNLFPRRPLLTDETHPVTMHEVMSVFFFLLLHILLFTRASHNKFVGWARSDQSTGHSYPMFEDASLFTVFAIFLHIMPKGFMFLRYVKAHKRRLLPPRKPESGVLYWKFVDSNTPYAFLFLMGAGEALLHTVVHHDDVKESVINAFNWLTSDITLGLSTFAMCQFGILLCNMMTGTGAAVVYLPAILLAQSGRRPLYALAGGLSCALGFISPFRHSTTYFTKKIGKVPFRMLLFHNFLSTVINAVMLWLMIISLGEYLFLPFGGGGGGGDGGGNGSDSFNGSDIVNGSDSVNDSGSDSLPPPTPPPPDS
ncbi:protein I'm not dead yet-like [Hyposmocoma kahamanoa]|uniref:protein I'm not dead yet-like n=1 Tax=Hyposmocoma kahamanoa TaxID=1477025 RepID=UPI000E6D70C8|nr:protein I'm not dead yet-like [Hyposmocoma kahamanoa]